MKSTNRIYFGGVLITLSLLLGVILMVFLRHADGWSDSIVILTAGVLGLIGFLSTFFGGLLIGGSLLLPRTTLLRVIGCIITLLCILFTLDAFLTVYFFQPQQYGYGWEYNHQKYAFTYQTSIAFLVGGSFLIGVKQGK